MHMPSAVHTPSGVHMSSGSTASGSTHAGTAQRAGTPRILVLDGQADLGERIEALAGELAPRPAVLTCSRPAAAAELLADDGPFDVLVAGPELGTRHGLEQLRLIREEAPTMAVVLAFSHRPQATLREIVRTGAVDLVQLPASDRDVLDALERGMGLARSATVVAPVVHGRDAPRTPGKLITIGSATGGCGKTFMATNLAYFLSRQSGVRACIVDLDLQFGEVSTAMRLRPKYTIVDALQRDAAQRDDADADLRAHISEYTVMHETGVHVLAAPKEPSEADRITPSDVTRIVTAVREQFDYVIVDTSPQLNEQVLAAFDMSDRLYVMATLDLPSVRNMSVFLSTLERLRIPADNVKLILNKAESDVGIDVAQVRKLFPQGFESVLPYAKEVSRSINLGMPVMASSPHAEISRLMAAGMANLLPEGDRSHLTAVPDGKRHRFNLRRRSA